MAREAHIEDGRFDASVLHHIDHLAHQRPRLPGKGTARLKNNVQPGIALAEALQQVDKQHHVVIDTCHQMSATEVNPFQLRKPLRKLRLDVLQGARKRVGAALTMAMTMKTFDVFRQLLGQLVGRDAKACAGRAGIIKRGAHLRIFGIDAQPKTDGRVDMLRPLVETCILRERIELQMARTTGYRVDFIIGISGRKRVGCTAKLLKGQTSLIQGTGGCSADILLENGKGFPQRKGLKSQNHLYTRLTSHLRNKT